MQNSRAAAASNGDSMRRLRLGSVCNSVRSSRDPNFRADEEVFNLAPGAGFGWWEAMLVEVLYTFMLCSVVLNVAATKATEGN